MGVWFRACIDVTALALLGPVPKNRSVAKAAGGASYPKYVPVSQTGMDLWWPVPPTTSVAVFCFIFFIELAWVCLRHTSGSDWVGLGANSSPPVATPLPYWSVSCNVGVGAGIVLPFVRTSRWTCWSLIVIKGMNSVEETSLWDIAPDVHGQWFQHIWEQLVSWSFLQCCGSLYLGSVLHCKLFFPCTESHHSSFL